MAPSRVRVLVVDPEESVAESLAAILNRSGFDAVAVFNGEQAIAEAAQRPYDFLLTEIEIKPQDGIQIARAILGLHPSIRVILLTASDGALPILVRAAQEGQVFPALAKPIHPDELLTWLRKERPSEDPDLSLVS